MHAQPNMLSFIHTAFTTLPNKVEGRGDHAHLGGRKYSLYDVTPLTQLVMRYLVL